MLDVTGMGRRGCDQNWRQFRLAVSTANESWRFNNCQFCWQLALPIEIGVLATANFVGSWHWQLSIGSWQLCIGSWQLSIGSERLATTIKKVAIVKTNIWMAVLLTGDPANWQY